MAFDFPNSPTTGQVANGYQWDGEKWKGGIPGVAGTQKEQFFDLSGKTQQDIAVPTWAKACQIIGFVRVSASASVILRASMDGAAFLAGASDYFNGGPLHNTGTSLYTTVAGAVGTSISLTTTGDNVNLSQAFTAEMEFTRPDTGRTFATKSFGRSLDSNAASSMRTWHNHGYVVAASAGSALAIKAIRILLSSAGTFVAGSHIHVQWLGDDAQLPVSNAIPEAPNDGYFWMRRNNQWEKFNGIIKDQQFIDATTMSATTAEVALSAPISFSPILTDSAIIVTCSAYCMIQSTAAIDDVRGRIYLKAYDGAVYNGAYGTALMGQVNALSSTTQAYYYRITLPPVSIPRRSAGVNVVTPRIYGLADYASVTLNCYDCTMRFQEVQV